MYISSTGEIFPVSKSFFSLNVIMGTSISAKYRLLKK